MGKRVSSNLKKDTEGYRDKKSHVDHNNRTASRKESNSSGANQQRTRCSIAKKDSKERSN